MRLIVNADDLGFSKGINYGIYDAYKNGIVTSTTIMMNAFFMEHAVELFRNEKIGIGVHLNVTSGRPLLKTHKVIVNEKGFFEKKETEITTQLLKEVKDEFEAQIEFALKKGIQITHLDSHHHVHMWNEELFKITKNLAFKYNLPIRCNRAYSFMSEKLQQGIKSTIEFSEEFFDKTVNVEFFLQILKMNLKIDSLEVMVHPGFLCGNLINVDSYREMRMVENSILTSDMVKKFIEIENIELINYSEL